MYFIFSSVNDVVRVSPIAHYFASTLPTHVIGSVGKLDVVIVIPPNEWFILLDPIDQMLLHENQFVRTPTESNAQVNIQLPTNLHSMYITASHITIITRLSFHHNYSSFKASKFGHFINGSRSQKA